MSTQRVQEAQQRIARCRQRCISNIVAARMEYAAHSARIEVEIDQVKVMLSRSGSETEVLEKCLLKLQIDLENVETAFWNARKRFIESVRFLGIDHGEAILYLGAWNLNVEGAIPMNVQQ
jgi:hypothetical protein